MATVLLHLNVKVPNAVAEQDEKEAVDAAKKVVFNSLMDGKFEDLVAMAEVVDYDE